jgi:hypothetical protein
MNGSSTTSAALPIVAHRCLVHLPYANDGQVDAVQSQQGTYERYPVHQAGNLRVGSYPEGSLKTGVRCPHDQPD